MSDIPTMDEIRAHYAESMAFVMGSDDHELGKDAFDRALTADRKAQRAEAWAEGLTAGQHRWMDAREFGDPPVNPYREASDSDSGDQSEQVDLVDALRKSIETARERRLAREASDVE